VNHRSAESEWFGNEEKNYIWSLVMELPRKQREVLLLATHYRLSMQEMSELIGVSEGTIKSRLHRARLTISSRLTANSVERSE
jgi:RNA polymerase sigma-70 factor (ECF subfamily)